MAGFWIFYNNNGLNKRDVHREGEVLVPDRVTTLPISSNYFLTVYPTAIATTRVDYDTLRSPVSSFKINEEEIVGLWSPKQA